MTSFVLFIFHLLDEQCDSMSEALILYRVATLMADFKAWLIRTVETAELLKENKADTCDEIKEHKIARDTLVKLKEDVIPLVVIDQLVRIIKKNNAEALITKFNEAVQEAGQMT